MGFDPQGRRVFVVGALGGIGAVTAHAFADVDAHLTAAGRPSDRLDAIAGELSVPAASLDILDNETTEGFFARKDAFHVVIAAAATKTEPVDTLPLDAALKALGRGLALQRAPVRVDTVSPGVIGTPLWRGMPMTNARRCSVGRRRGSRPSRRPSGGCRPGHPVPPRQQLHHRHDRNDRRGRHHRLNAGEPSCSTM